MHKGFYLGYLSVAQQVRDNIKEHLQKYPKAKIYVTGFSLGGALATVAALDIKYNFGHVDEYYGFGQPRVGNKFFAKHF